MSTNSPQLPSEEETRFKEAMRRILSLTPEQQEEVKRKVAEEAQKQKAAARKQQSEETPGG
jgi:hypothetical protein